MLIDPACPPMTREQFVIAGEWVKSSRWHAPPPSAVFGSTLFGLRGCQKAVPKCVSSPLDFSPVGLDCELSKKMVRLTVEWIHSTPAGTMRSGSGFALQFEMNPDPYDLRIGFNRTARSGRVARYDRPVVLSFDSSRSQAGFQLDSGAQ